MNGLFVLCLAAVALIYVDAITNVAHGAGGCPKSCQYGNLPKSCTCRPPGDIGFPTCATVRCLPWYRCVMFGVSPMCVPIFNDHHPDFCHFPPDSGRCFANFERFYFDVFAGRCLRFVYGGCDGNANRFRTPFECERTCGRPF